MILSKNLIILGLISNLFIQNPLYLDTNIYKQNHLINDNSILVVPKYNDILKIKTINNLDTIDYLDSFLNQKIKTVAKNKTIAIANGKTTLASLNSVWDVANYLVGSEGDCFYIAQLFINIYMGEGHLIANAYEVDTPAPGDVIYYADGGLGIEHWAIYLGQDLALHGNYSGRATIGAAQLNNASKGVYYRIP